APGPVVVAWVVVVVAGVGAGSRADAVGPPCLVRSQEPNGAEFSYLFDASLWTGRQPGRRRTGRCLALNPGGSRADFAPFDASLNGPAADFAPFDASLRCVPDRPLSGAGAVVCAAPPPPSGPFERRAPSGGAPRDRPGRRSGPRTPRRGQAGRGPS